MSTQAMNPSEPNTEETNRRLNRDIMDMITNLTHNLAPLQRDPKAAGGTGPTSNEDEFGVSIITMAGNNSGATLKSFPTNSLADMAPNQEAEEASPEWATVVNSNLQAINNSVMLGTKYKSHDPGVHMEISEDLEPEDHKHDKRGGWKKGKRKDGHDSSGSKNSSGADDQ